MAKYIFPLSGIVTIFPTSLAYAQAAGAASGDGGIFFQLLPVIVILLAVGLFIYWRSKGDSRSSPFKAENDGPRETAGKVSSSARISLSIVGVIVGAGLSWVFRPSYLDAAMPLRYILDSSERVSQWTTTAAICFSASIFVGWLIGNVIDGKKPTETKNE